MAAGLVRMWDALGHPALFGLAATLIAGYPIFKDAFADPIARRITTALSVSIALVAALGICDVFTTYGKEIPEA